MRKADIQQIESFFQELSTKGVPRCFVVFKIGSFGSDNKSKLRRCLVQLVLCPFHAVFRCDAPRCSDNL
jgi:hypothetical protein